MPTYKDITAPTLELVYQAVKYNLDFITGIDNSIEDIQAMVDEYLAGKVDRDDLLADIDGELSWIPGERDVLQNAIDVVIPGLSIPANARAVLSGLADNQRRILQQNYRQLKVWKFLINNLTID